MTSLLARAAALAFCLAFAAAAAPANPYSTMWGAHHCPAEIVPDQGGGNGSEGSPLLGTNWGLDFSDMRRLCREAPHAVICAGHPGKALTLAQVYKIDHEFRAHFMYRSDMATAGVSDYWRHWSICGDCEDYALTLSELLARAGEGGRFMRLQLMEVPLDILATRWGGHATLWVTTSDAGSVEISVGDDEGPMRIDPDAGLRMATIRMDGKRTPVALKGFHIESYRGDWAVAPNE